jgi:hypothetical protein
VGEKMNLREEVARVIQREADTAGCYLLDDQAQHAADAAITVIEQDQARLQLEWRDGAPPHPWDKEWFIARTTFGDRVALTALPEEYSYDFKTADGTYLKREVIAAWMQFPDSEYVAPAKPAVSEEARTFLEFWEQNPTGPVTVRAATRLRAAIAALTKEAPHAD